MCYVVYNLCGSVFTLIWTYTILKIEVILRLIFIGFYLLRSKIPNEVDLKFIQWSLQLCMPTIQIKSNFQDVHRDLL